MHYHPCVLACLALSVTASAVPVQWKVKDGGNGNLYALVGDYLDPAQRWRWHEAKIMAEEMGGHLVTITSAEENQFLIETFHVHHQWPVWLGLTDSEAYGGYESFGQPDPTRDGWVWVTGEPVTFTGWVPGSPDQTQVDEDAALMGSQWGEHNLWNDAQPNDHAPFFIEWEVPRRNVPDASPFAFTIACAALLGMRRTLNSGR